MLFRFWILQFCLYWIALCKPSSRNDLGYLSPGRQFLCFQSAMSFGYDRFGAKDEKKRKVLCPPRTLGCMTAHYSK